MSNDSNEPGNRRYRTSPSMIGRQPGEGEAWRYCWRCEAETIGPEDGPQPACPECEAEMRDSNEQGNDTAAQAAFQVGDTVAYEPMGFDAFCLVTGVFNVNGQPRYDLRLTIDPIDAEGRTGDTIEKAYGDDLTLISRATPAPAPAQTAPERNSFAVTMPCVFGKHAECDGRLRVGNLATPDVVSSPCECECHQHSEPATPAPAATVDIEWLAGSVRTARNAVHDAESLTTDQTEDEVREALNAIAGALDALHHAVRTLVDSPKS